MTSMAGPDPSSRRFLGASALLFLASAALTSFLCGSMSAMSGMPMRGGWTMSSVWMPMPRQPWFMAAATFIGTWSVMMTAMMLPPLVPMLLRFREAVAGTGATRLCGPTTIAAMGYFFVWTVLGVIVFPVGIALAALEMQHPPLARAVPSIAGVVAAVSGLVQFTEWKARRLSCCRDAPVRASERSAESAAAWRHGVRLGLHCACCCANLMAVVFAAGIMDLRAMAILTVAIAAERLPRAGAKVARATGAVIVMTGAALFARAAMLI